MAVVKYASPKKPRRKQADQLTTMRAHTADPLKSCPTPARFIAGLARRQGVRRLRCNRRKRGYGPLLA